MESIDPSNLTDRELLLLTYEKVEAIEGQQKKIDARFDLYSTRIRALEHWRTFLGGGVALCALLWQAVVAGWLHVGK